MVLAATVVVAVVGRFGAARESDEPRRFLLDRSVPLTDNALDLCAPTAVSAEGPPFDPISTPAWCFAHY